MSRHSLGAYRIVLMMRSDRTILVEGETDKTVLHRLMLDVDGGGARPNIDTPALLSDARLRGLGNKAQVELVASEVGQSDNFLVLVDREWEHFRQDQLQLEDLDELLGPTDGIVRTYGHSIENYFFDAEAFKTFLRRQFAPYLTAGALRLVDERFYDMCLIALAYSLAARDHEIIRRLDDLLGRGDLAVGAESIGLVPGFEAKLVARGVTPEVATGFAEAVDRYVRAIRDAQVPATTLKWASHGHLGSQVLWSCVAKVLEMLGTEQSACEQIERGMRVEKLKHWADVLALGTAERRPLRWLVQWLYRLDTADAPNDPGAMAAVETL